MVNSFVAQELEPGILISLANTVIELRNGARLMRPVPNLYRRYLLQLFIQTFVIHRSSWSKVRAKEAPDDGDSPPSAKLETRYRPPDTDKSALDRESRITFYLEDRAIRDRIKGYIKFSARIAATGVFP